eukprot:3076900-Rhodomonas_salina.5
MLPDNSAPLCNTAPLRISAPLRAARADRWRGAGAEESVAAAAGSHRQLEAPGPQKQKVRVLPLLRDRPGTAPSATSYATRYAQSCPDLRMLVRQGFVPAASGADRVQ